MFACLTTFRLAPGQRAIQEERARRFVATYRAMPGFRSVTYLIDESTHEYGAFSVWESRADAEAAGAAARARMAENPAEHIRATPTTRIFEIYEPPT
jgi:heme-degrading monooxygenase HmoA